MGTCSCHASQMSGRFIRPTFVRMKSGAQNMANYTITSHHRRTRLLETSAIAFGAPLTIILLVSFECSSIGNPL